MQYFANSDRGRVRPYHQDRTLTLPLAGGGLLAAVFDGMGGHADGDWDLLRVAKKEVMEECGLPELTEVSPDIFSLEILSVAGHEKKGRYLSSHLHLNVTYLFEADPAQPLRIKPDENSAVGWVKVEDIPQKTNEAWFRERIYSKLCEKTAQRTT